MLKALEGGGRGFAAAGEVSREGKVINYSLVKIDEGKQNRSRYGVWREEFT